MAKILNYLLDTCILIDYLRGTPSIYDFLVKKEKIGLAMSMVTMMELILGALNKREVNFIQRAFGKIEMIYINEDMSKMAENLMVNYSKSHNLQIDDALIAATSLKMDMEFITYNIADFRFIPDIKLYQFK